MKNEAPLPSGMEQVLRQLRGRDACAREIVSWADPGRRRFHIADLTPPGVEVFL